MKRYTSKTCGPWVAMHMPNSEGTTTPHGCFSSATWFGALRALAADRLDMNVKVLFAVVVAQFLPSFDCSLRPYPNAATRNYCFGIRSARMVYVAGEIAAWRAVNRPLGIDAKEILASGPLIYLSV